MMAPRVLVLFAIGLFFSSAFADTSVAPNRFAFTNVTVIDSENGVRTDQTVFVEGQVIALMGDIDLPTDVFKIDARGKYLIPGLWDAHVHLTYIPGFDNILDLFLANGVTSVRDTGGQRSALEPFVDIAEKEPTSYPQIYVSGPLLDGSLNVYSGSDPAHPSMGIPLHDEAAARAAVRNLHEWGADFFKVYEMLDPEAYYGIVRQAAVYNKPVTGHVPLSMDAVAVAESGINSLEHLRNLELSCSSDWEFLLEERQAILALDEERQGHHVRSAIHREQRELAHSTYSAQRCEKVVKSLKDNSVFQVPTLALNLAPTRRHFARAEWQRNYSVLPVALRDLFHQFTEQALKLEPSELDRQNERWMHRAMALLVQAEVPIMAGTDSPIYLLTPGFSLHEELAVLVEFGLTPMQALASATSTPARYFGVEGKVGTIGPGKTADLVLLDENPLLDIRNVGEIRAVVRAGKLYNRAALDEMLASGK